jgi:hypothetical protein
VGHQLTKESSVNMTIYKIEHDVPFTVRGARLSYPFSEMKVGDSFALPVKDQKKVAAAACHHGKRHKMKLSVRKDPQNKARYRCWRVK